MADPRVSHKKRRSARCSVSPAATEIIESLPRIGKAGFVFTTTGESHVTGYSRSKARLDAKMALDASGAISPWTLHDLRRTMASGMARLNINLPVIEKVLNHTSGSFGGIVGVYQRHEFSNEKRQALEAWGRFVTDLIEGKPRDSNVVARLREQL